MGDDKGLVEFTDVTQWSPSGPLAKLKVESFAGNIVARGGEAAAVVATIRVKAKDEEEAKNLFEKVELGWKEKNDKATVKADFKKALADLFSGDRVRVDFDITIPAAATLELGFGAGDVTAMGIAALSANIGSGNIESDAPSILGKCGNSRIHALKPVYLDLDVGNGGVRVDDGAALETFKFNAGNGEVWLETARLHETAAYKFKMGNGTFYFGFGRKPTNCLITINSLASDLKTAVAFNKDGGKMYYQDGEPKAKITIDAAHSKAEFAVKEAS